MILMMKKPTSTAKIQKSTSNPGSGLRTPVGTLLVRCTTLCM